MNDLRRELAPITDAAWQEIEQEATRSLKTCLAGRKLVDFTGPMGWDYSAVNLGRVKPLGNGPGDEVEARLRVVRPLVELRKVFELSRHELDGVDRGAADPDLQPLIQAATQLACAEDRLVFHGYSGAQIEGICSGSAHAPLPIGEDFTAYPGIILRAIEVLREAGVAGPFAIALGPETYNGLARTVQGGYPVIRHVERLIEGPLVWAPALQGAVVLSLRGMDFELVVGRDISLGYLDHDQTAVRLYLEESLSFRLITPEAAVPLQVK